MALIELAESLKESEDWEMATNTMKKIQSDWKKIGHVPRKFSDDIWKRFKAACDIFFNARKAHYKAQDKEKEACFKEKTELLFLYFNNNAVTSKLELFFMLLVSLE